MGSASVEVLHSLVIGAGQAGPATSYFLRRRGIDRVESDEDLLVVRAGDRVWRTRTVINARGTWTRPFAPFYPGIGTSAGEQVHTAHYPGAEHFRGKLAPVTDTLWVTRRPPVWRERFGAAAGLAR